MTVDTRITVAGIDDAIRALNKIEPGLRKEFAAEAPIIRHQIPGQDRIANGLRDLGRKIFFSRFLLRF